MASRCEANRSQRERFNFGQSTDRENHRRSDVDRDFEPFIDRSADSHVCQNRLNSIGLEPTFDGLSTHWLAQLESAPADGQRCPSYGAIRCPAFSFSLFPAVANVIA